MAVSLGASGAALICFCPPRFELRGGDVEGVLEVVTLVFSDGFGEEAGVSADADYFVLQ